MSDTHLTPTGSDPLIDEVRAIRRTISEHYGHDVDRLCDHRQELERQHGDWTIVAEPQGAPTADMSSDLAR
jgi:hypothetical protein